MDKQNINEIISKQEYYNRSTLFVALSFHSFFKYVLANSIYKRLLLGTGFNIITNLTFLNRTTMILQLVALIVNLEEHCMHLRCVLWHSKDSNLIAKAQTSAMFLEKVSATKFCGPGKYSKPNEAVLH